MNKRKLIRPMLIILIVAFVLVSCATKMRTRPTQVRLVTVEQVHEVEVQCKFVGNVTGASFPVGGCLSWWDTMRDIAHNNALNELLDNAAELGATHVFVNLGDYPDLRGEAYTCTYCKDPYGNPDVAYCQDVNGNLDVGSCINPRGNIVGAAHCKDAEGKTPVKCKENCGTWVPMINKKACETLGYKWIPKAEDKRTCERKGYVWIPKAEDQITCESKGGTWVIDEEVLHRSPESWLSDDTR